MQKQHLLQKMERKNRRKKRPTAVSESAPGTWVACRRARRGPFGGVLPPLRRHSDGKVVRALRQIETDAFQPSGRHGVPKGSAVQVRRLSSNSSSSGGGVGQKTRRERVYTTQLLVLESASATLKRMDKQKDPTLTLSHAHGPGRPRRH